MSLIEKLKEQRFKFTDSNDERDLILKFLNKNEVIIRIFDKTIPRANCKCIKNDDGKIFIMDPEINPVIMDYDSEGIEPEEPSVGEIAREQINKDLQLRRTKLDVLIRLYIYLQGIKQGKGDLAPLGTYTLEILDEIITAINDRGFQ